MLLTDVDFAAVARAVRCAPKDFATRDVSEQPAMLEAHPMAVDRNYHGMIGRYLRRHTVELGIRLSKTHTRRGARWAKTT